MADESMTDREIRTLLDAVSQDRATEHPNRDELRRAIVADFRAQVTSDSRTAEPAMNLPSGSDAVSAYGSLSGSVPPSRDIGRARAIVGIAASLVLAAAFAWGWPAGRTTTVTDLAAPAPLATQDQGQALPAGHYGAGDIATGLAVTLADDVLVSAVGPGFVELQPVEDSWGASLFLLSADGELEALLEQYQADGLVTIVRGAADGRGGLSPDFEVRPTNAARLESCRLDPDCLAIGAAQIDPAGVNVVREVAGPGGAVVWALYQSDTAYAPFQRIAGDIVSTLTFEPES